MRSNAPDLQARILAQALFEIRVLLAGYLGSQNSADMEVRRAAHLAYAVHNEALAVVEDRQFNPIDFLTRLQAMDAMLGSAFATRFRDLLDARGDS
jgi:hypothetical protein